MKLFRLCLLLMVFLLVGCDESGESRGQESRLEVIHPSFANEEFYLEGFDLSMIQIRFVDQAGVEEIVHLDDEIVVSEPPVTEGTYTVHVRYRDHYLTFDIWIRHVHMISCEMRVELHDFTRDRWMGDWISDWFEVPEGEVCTVPYLPDPQELNGYTFSHFSHGVGDELEFEPTVKAYYEPFTIEVRFYDDLGELMETREVLYGDSVTDPPGPGDFPEYYTFYNWMPSPDNITEPRDFHPNGYTQTYNVWFYDKHGDMIDHQSVKLGRDAEPPEVPGEIDGYIHTGWSESLEDIRQYMEIHAVYERAFKLEDVIDELFSDNNFTIEVHWQDTPIGDYINTLMFDDNKVHVDMYGRNPSYLVTEADVLYVIGQYDFDDYTDWHKDEWIGEPPEIKDWMLIDVLSMGEEMFSYSEGVYTLSQNDFDELFQGDVSEEINTVTLEVDDEGMHFTIQWHHGETTEVFVYAIGETVVELPEYVEE